MQSRDKLRRLRILQNLATVAPSPMGEHGLLAALKADPELTPTIDLVRQSVQYLAANNLVVVVQVDGHPWVAASISGTGQAWLKEPGDHGLDIYSPDYITPASKHQGRVSSVQTLPPEVKAWLDQELIRLGFRDYTGLKNALSGKGWEISRSALGRYGKKVKEDQKRLKETVEISKAFAQVVGDDGGAMAQSLTALMQQEAMAIVREGRYASEDVPLPKLIQAVSSLNKSDLAVKQYAAEVRQKALAEAAEKAEKGMAQQGMTQETVAAIKADILGL